MDSVAYVGEKMISIISLLEMAVPTEEIKSRTYYHGTTDRRDALNIMKRGLGNYKITHGGFSNTKSNNYITSNIRIAVSYATNACGGIDDVKCIKDDVIDSDIGFVVVIKGDQLRDISIDEDQVGLLILRKKIKWLNNIFYEKLYDEQLEIPPVHLNSNKKYIPSSLTYGEALDYVSGRENDNLELYEKIGNKMISFLSDEQINSIAELTTNVVHRGILEASECWLITGKQVKKDLNNTFSNFFEVAKRIK